MLAARRFFRNKPATIGVVVVLLFAFVGITAPILAPQDPTALNVADDLASPSLDHLLGTDFLGRDTLSRLMHGARISLTVGVLSQLVVLGIGIPVGLTAGFGGTRVDNAIMRGVDVVFAVPDLLIIILLRAIFGSNIFMILLAVGLAFWPTMARLVRGLVLSIKREDYLTAAQATGARTHQILLRHVMPNILGSVLVATAFLIPKAIFAEAALSFIGIGVVPPTPSWGSMVQENYGDIFVAYEQTLFPAAAIALASVAFTLIGDGLRDFLDPRTP